MFLDNLLKSKCKIIAIILLLIVVTAIISSMITYHIAFREVPDATYSNIDFEETTSDNISANVETFFEMTENLKQKAKMVNTMSEWTEKRDAVTEIGETLKEIMISDYSSLLTNDTFNDNAFSVTITVYPLRENRILRKIDYALRLNDDSTNGVPYEEKRFFLQFCGENIFFTDIDYMQSNETDFYVFENTEGCFAFSLLDYRNYISFNTNETITNYQATVYIPRDNAFTVEDFIDIPLKVISSDSLRLVQEDDIIKTLISNPQNLSVCIFKSENISFELIKNEIKSSSIDYDMPGLLLGLSDSHGNIRTLSICKEDGKISVDEYSDQIIFSRKNILFILKHYTLKEDFYGDEFENETEYRTGALDIKKFICAPIGVDLTDIYNHIFDSDASWSYYNNLDIPLYIGEDYICYIQNSSHSGGGTWRLSPSCIRFDKLDNLSDFIYDDKSWVYGGIVPDFDEKPLCELIYGNKAEDYYQSNITTYGGETNPYVDFTQLSLKRNLGKWSLMLPIMEEYHHPGNGSYSNWIKTFAVYSNDVPDFLNTKDEIVELGGWNNWNAKDLFKFPDSDATLYQYDYFIGICSQSDSPQEPEDYDVFVPVDIDEYIVSISFSNTGTQETWMNELSKIK